jgi:Bacterial capsule synthesis protein PGA_cap
MLFPHFSKFKLIILVVTLVLSVSIVAFSIFLNNQNSNKLTPNNSISSNLSSNVQTVSSSSTSTSSAFYSQNLPKITSITNKSLFMGNIFFGRYIDDWSVQSANPELQKIPNYKAKRDDTRNYNYPFSKLDTFEKSKYDSWIAGLECPVTNTFIDSFTQDDTLNFSCLPGYISEAKKYFDVFTLANNHIDNMQNINGFENTRNVLDSNQIQYFGHFDNSVKSDICEIVSIKASLNYSDMTTNKSYIPVAFCGYHNVFKLPTQDQIDVISEYSKYFPTIVMPHQGAEYQTRSDQLKQEIYHKFVEAGSDLVVGDHPHATQEIEYYKDKLIVYSLGNFIFDQQYNSLVTSAITLDSEMTLEGGDLGKYLELGQGCEVFKDDCLKKFQQASPKIEKPKISFKFDIVASDNSNKITKKANPEIQKRMEQVTGFRTLNVPKK